MAVVTTQSDSGKGVYTVVILNASTTSRDRRSRFGLPTNLQVARQSRWPKWWQLAQKTPPKSSLLLGGVAFGVYHCQTYTSTFCLRLLYHMYNLNAIFIFSQNCPGRVMKLEASWKQCHLARCSIFCLGKQMVLPQNEVTQVYQGQTPMWSTFCQLKNWMTNIPDR